METSSASVITSSNSRFNSRARQKHPARGSRLLAILGATGFASPAFATEAPWVARTDVPLPAGIESVEIVRADEPLFQKPERGASRRGAARQGAHLPLYAVTR